MIIRLNCIAPQETENSEGNCIVFSKLKTILGSGNKIIGYIRLNLSLITTVNSGQNILKLRCLKAFYSN